jgi:hypothetical protein
MTDDNIVIIEIKRLNKEQKKEEIVEKDKRGMFGLLIDWRL